MAKRKWTDIKKPEPESLRLREEGKTRQEIADLLGLEKIQVKNWVNRYNREQSRLAAGVPSKRRGRPATGKPKNEKEYQREIERLKMENQLLRDFLRLTGRK